MYSSPILEQIDKSVPFLCMAALFVMFRRKQLARFGFVSAYLALEGAALALALIALSPHRYVSPPLGYRIYFYDYWVSMILQVILLACVVYQLCWEALAPLGGLRRLGQIALLTTCGAALVLSAILSPPAARFMVIGVINRLNIAESAMTLTALVILSLLLRPVGLSLRSRTAGIGLGLAVLSCCQLVIALPLFIYGSMKVRAVLSVVTMPLVIILWMIYLWLPEPQRTPVALQSSSRLARWNEFWVDAMEDKSAEAF